MNYEDSDKHAYTESNIDDIIYVAGQLCIGPAGSHVFAVHV